MQDTPTSDDSTINPRIALVPTDENSLSDEHLDEMECTTLALEAIDLAVTLDSDALEAAALFLIGSGDDFRRPTAYALAQAYDVDVADIWEAYHDLRTAIDRKYALLLARDRISYEAAARPRMAEYKEKMLVADGGEEMVYVTGGLGGGGVIHTDPECYNLAKADQIVEKPRSTLQSDKPVCRVCSGNRKRPRAGSMGTWKTLEAMSPDDLIADGGVPQSDETVPRFSEDTGEVENRPRNYLSTNSDMSEQRQETETRTGDDDQEIDPDEVIAELEGTSIPGHDDLTRFKFDILTRLQEEPKYGLRIKRELEEKYGTEVNHGRVYPNLNDLTNKGLVSKSERDKRTNEYALTNAGMATIREFVSWWTEYADPRVVETAVADGGEGARD